MAIFLTQPQIALSYFMFADLLIILYLSPAAKDLIAINYHSVGVKLEFV